MRNERSDCGADDRAHASDYCPSAYARDAGAKLVVVTAADTGADAKARAKSDQRADGRALASSPGSRAVALYFEHVFFFSSHRPGSDLLGRPGLEYAGHRPCFQGEADVIARPQLSERLPITPILGVNRRGDATHGGENQK